GCNGNAVTTPCTPAQEARIIDLVGYGNATYFEGAAAPTLTNTTAAVRAGGGCTDTNNNSADFAAAAPAPRNSASPVNPCGSPPADSAPSVISTTPANNATNVARDTSISITFSEPVDATAASFELNCTSGAVPFGLSGGPTTYTIDPSSDLPGGEASSVRVIAAAVSDQDTNDPPDTMAEDYIFSFDVSSDLPPCEQPFTPIYAIQGSGTSAAITGNITTQGVVVGDFEGPTSVGLQGFYIQDALGDGDPATSDGIFVYTGNSNLVNIGQLVRVTGFARERFDMTAINGTDNNAAAVPAANIIVCGSGSVDPVDVTMPFPNATYLERYEGMLVRLPQALQISEYFNYDRFGEIVLALPLDGEPRAYTGTAVDAPGAPANARALANNLRRLTLDDGLGSQNPAAVRHPNGAPFSLSNRFRGGDLVQNTVGILSYDFSLYRIQPTAPAEYQAVNLRPETPDEVGGSLKVSAFNTLNYFLTLDYPAGDPRDNACGPLQNVECRGADFDQPDEFERQRAKLLAAIEGLDADVLGLIELENTTGVEAMADLVAGLNDRLGAGTYAYIDTGTIGTDAIKVGIIYRPAAVTPVGGYAILNSSVDPAFIDTLNRPVLAQTFAETTSGERFTVAVAHLKSKGSACSGDPDLGDGQGNCNLTRLAAAQAMVRWLDSDPTGSGDPDYLILGDLNSYTREDPINAVIAGPDGIIGTDDDYTNLILQYQGTFAYSYVFDGQYGYLDHALASASLAPQVTGATEWHINADEPDLIDYDTSFKPAEQDALYEPNAFRSSDHDPVLVGLGLDGTAPETTATVSGVVKPGCAADCFFGSATVSLNANEPATIVYRVNGGAWVTYSAPFAVTAIGNNLVEFYATDTIGNVEATRSVIVKVTNFPIAGLLDTFNRANGRIGNNWLGDTKIDQYAITNGRIDVGLGGQLLWRGDTFGADQEAYLTLSKIDNQSAHHTLVLKSRGTNSSQGAILVSYDAVQQAIVVEALVVGTGWRTVATFPVVLSDGAVLGARANADGTLQVYVDCVLIGSADSRTVAGNAYVGQGGRIGVWFWNAANAEFDDFSGGNHTP
ncbi:MAG TPA: ExeM/NucH family extracellular endonuclease, partial [Roseiflexaceae bacterium]|nr:ExeM/NucH family extracellular endonuclease [Roseiflexaceae bacterium]